MKSKLLLVAIALLVTFFFPAGLAIAQTSSFAWCHIFSVYLKSGDTDVTKNGEVTQLQKALTKEGFDVSTSTPGVFGFVTKSAVVAFQNKYALDILIPNGFTVGTGIVGQFTQAKLNDLYGCVTNRNDVAVQIQNLQDASVDYHAMNTGSGYSDFCENKTSNISNTVNQDNYSFTCNDKTNKSNVCTNSQWAAVACSNNDDTDCFCTDASGLVNNGSFYALNTSINGNCDCSHTPAPVIAVAPVLIGLSIINSPNKLLYNIGDPLDINGLQIFGYYDDGSIQKEPVASSDIFGFDSSAPNPLEALTIAYGGQTTEYYVDISATPIPAIPATNLTLSDHATTINSIGNKYQLYGIIAPADSTQYITWSSDDPSVATVDEDGIVTAVTLGTASITATAGTATDKDIITVGPTPIPVTGITLNLKTFSSVMGYTTKVIASIIPADATNKNITWTSSNAGIAKVDASGNVTAVFPGTAQITATAAGATKNAPTATATVVVYGGGGGGGAAIGPSIAFSQNVYNLSSIGATVSMPYTINNYSGDQTATCTSTLTQYVTVVSENGDCKATAVAFTPMQITSVPIIVQIGSVTSTAGVAVINEGGGSVPSLQSIAVTTMPTKVIYGPGSSLDLSGMIVTGTYSDNSTQVLTISNSNVTGFNSSTPGIETLTLAYGTKTTTFDVTVNHTNTVYPNLARIVLYPSAESYLLSNASEKFEPGVTLYDTNGTQIPSSTSIELVWTSSNPSVASVDPVTGHVTALSVGETDIKAYNGLVESNAMVFTVSDTPSYLASLAPTLSSTTLTVGGGNAYVVSVDTLDQYGQHINAMVSTSWSSSNTNVATIDAMGNIFPVSAGTATLIVTGGGVSGSATVTVTSPMGLNYSQNTIASISNALKVIEREILKLFRR